MIAMNLRGEMSVAASATDGAPGPSGDQELMEKLVESMKISCNEVKHPIRSVTFGKISESK